MLQPTGSECLQSDCLHLKLSSPEESSDLDKLLNTSNLIFLTFKIHTIIALYRVTVRNGCVMPVEVSGPQETTVVVDFRLPWSCRLVSSW